MAYSDFMIPPVDVIGKATVKFVKDVHTNIDLFAYLILELS